MPTITECWEEVPLVGDGESELTVLIIVDVCETILVNVSAIEMDVLVNVSVIAFIQARSSG